MRRVEGSSGACGRGVIGRPAAFVAAAALLVACGASHGAELDGDDDAATAEMAAGTDGEGAAGGFGAAPHPSSGQSSSAGTSGERRCTPVDPSSEFSPCLEDVETADAATPDATEGSARPDAAQAEGGAMPASDAGSGPCSESVNVEIEIAGPGDGGQGFETVQLMFDASAAGLDAFAGASSRREATREVLFGPDGLLTGWQSSLYLGATTSHADNSISCATISTPALDRFARLDNAAGVEATMDSLGPSGWTVAEVAPDLALVFDEAASSRSDLEPVYIGRSANLLIFYGVPSTCGFLDATPNYELGIEPVQRAYAAGVETFVIDLAVQNAEAVDYFDRLAQEGGTGQAFHVTDLDELRAAVRSVLAPAAACAFSLGSVAPADPTSVVAFFDGNELQPNAEDGFAWSGDMVELHGEACARAQDGGPHVLRLLSRDCGPQPLP